MANINGTVGADVVTVESGNTYFGLAGDDTITLNGWANAEGDAGNDTLIAGTGLFWYGPAVYYWSADQSIFVDLTLGYALDGLGGRDTLIDIHHVDGFQRPGDVGIGSDAGDQFHLGSSYMGAGIITLDGRGGSDLVSINATQLQENKAGELVVTVSADGRAAWVHTENWADRIFELHNIEYVQANYWPSNRVVDYDIGALIDLSRAGEQILLRESKGWQSAAVGTPITLTYSFLQSVPTTGGEGGTGFVAFDGNQQELVREVFAKLSLQTGLSFVEVSDAVGQIRFGINQQAATRGYSFLPNDASGDSRSGDVWLDVETAAVLQAGQEGYYVLLHELAHALGLQHPLPETDTSGSTVLLDRFENFTNTLMIDRSASETSEWPTWFGAFDLQALRALYGVRPYAIGNDDYRIDDLQARRGVAIVDDGGVDTLDMSSVLGSVLVDLRPGHDSNVGLDAQGFSLVNNVSILGGAWIENLVLSRFDDAVTGNRLDNRITTMGGNDAIDGQEGLDVVVLAGTRSQWRVEASDLAGVWFASNSANLADSVRLTNVERLSFSNTELALDVAGTGGQAYRLYQAAFNRTPDLPGLGFWIAALDSGFGLNQAAAQFISSVEFQGLYGLNPSSNQFIALLYQNVLHRAPDQSGYDFWNAAMINADGAYGHEWTRSEVLAQFSESAENKANVIGVIQGGFEYTAWVQ